MSEPIDNSITLVPKADESYDGTSQCEKEEPMMTRVVAVGLSEKSLLARTFE
jgi:hypothetical protein